MSSAGVPGVNYYYAAVTTRWCEIVPIIVAASSREHAREQGEGKGFLHAVVGPFESEDEAFADFEWRDNGNEWKGW